MTRADNYYAPWLATGPTTARSLLGTGGSQVMWWVNRAGNAVPLEIALANPPVITALPFPFPARVGVVQAPVAPSTPTQLVLPFALPASLNL